VSAEEMLSFINRWKELASDGWIQRGVENQLRAEAGLPKVPVHLRGSLRRCLALLIPDEDSTSGSSSPKEAEARVREWLKPQMEEGCAAAIEVAHELESLPDNRGRQDSSGVFEISCFEGEPLLWLGGIPGIGVRTSKDPESGRRRLEPYASAIASSPVGAAGPVLWGETNADGKLRPAVALQKVYEAGGVGVSTGHPIRGKDIRWETPFAVSVYAGERNVGGGIEFPMIALALIPALRPFVMDMGWLHFTTWPKVTFLWGDPRLEGVNRAAIKGIAASSAVASELIAPVKSAGAKIVAKTKSAASHVKHRGSGSTKGAPGDPSVPEGDFDPAEMDADQT
jgi:hypothetical protein